MPKTIPVPMAKAMRPPTPAAPPVYRPNTAAPVQAKSALPAVRPPPAAPPVFRPLPRTVIQRSELPKSIAYSSIADHYTPEQIALAAQQTGHNTGYTGHGSGGPGDGMNNATVGANADIVEQLRKNVAKDKANKNKAPVRNERPKSARWRALNKARLLMIEALGPSALNAAAAMAKAAKDYDNYLRERSKPGTAPDDLLSATDVDDCETYWADMEGAEKVLDTPE